MAPTNASYSVKPWIWNLETAPAWFDLIYVTSWRNDGILHWLCNFSKSNAFGENFRRTKFILHKIFFRIGILSSRKISWMFFLRGRTCLVTKININFFVRNEVLNIFHITIFSKNKTKQNSEITEKNNFFGVGGMTIFQRMGCWTTKMSITFSMGNGIPNTALKFFPQKPHTGWIKTKEPVWGANFLPYRWFC